ncbi:MAG: phosphoserine transaminase [Hyphomicrobium sp.]|uniref:phosphoserine transaminase n=1 Tax=Hyphomicrobium sp. TaxID=82 RepID=UPI001327269B|nr:phosphoserine transaminase [Hyphomicrobium sp.]KAB2940056.1 MAG: phosphoserine transaminase [Hyphomicrobium sp.]MBZ0209573.1 phosphoserine transaminase [Hyphomicrobium sp.]
MTRLDKPTQRPGSPNFSSGPCAKRPGWTPDALRAALVGRSHRSGAGKARLKLAIDKTRALLRLPADYRVAIVPGSDTGAFEMAMWSLLGARGVDVLAWEDFGKGWVTDIVKQLRLQDVRVLEADYGALPDLKAVNWNHDVVFTWNGTTSGVRVPNGDWIPSDRAGLSLIDATSAVFAQAIDWAKADVVTYSWQKILGGEAAHGMLILSPRAVQRLESYSPPWPMPKIFRMKKDGKLNAAIFAGETINTPSMLCVEDYLDTLAWAESIGGLTALHRRADDNAAVLFDWMARTPWITNLTIEPATRSNTSVCMRFTGVPGGPAEERRLAEHMVARLAEEGVAYDIGSYRTAPPGLRVWCGATVERSDLEALTAWLEWAYAEARAAVG